MNLKNSKFTNPDIIMPFCKSRDTGSISADETLDCDDDNFDGSSTTTHVDLHKPEDLPRYDSFGQYKQLGSIGIGLAGVIGEIVLSHPWIVLRRQCQVQSKCRVFHLLPFSVGAVFYHISRHQGIAALWKGIGSVMMVRGVGLLSESVISEFTSLPKEISNHSNLKRLGQHLLLKSLSFVICAPFYAASFCETVQSEIVSERPGLFDCLMEGLHRFKPSTGSISRMLPVWKLMTPMVLLGVGKYILSCAVSITMHQILHGEDHDDAVITTKTVNDAGGSGDHHPITNNSSTSDLYNHYYSELVTSFAASFISDITLYPLETLLHRLCVQGTRTLIDNTDYPEATVCRVIPVVAYDGMLDAFRVILLSEGMLGFYKGIGALMIQYAIHLAMLKMIKFGFQELLIGRSNNTVNKVGQETPRSSPAKRRMIF